MLRAAVAALAATLLACTASIPSSTSKGPGSHHAEVSSTVSNLLPTATGGNKNVPEVAPPGIGTGLNSGTGLIANNVGNVISNNGGNVISNNAGNLTGKVKAPASIISDQGGGLISDQGGAIISDHGSAIIANNGGGYRLLALDEVPVANAEVHLTDAAGKAITGTDGSPLIAKTDASGNYSFDATLPKLNLLLSVTLNGGKGQLTAVAPRDAGDKRQADIELISTLTTSYILDQYVKGQVDPVKTFEKLPGDVEAETRKKAQDALNASGVATPDALTTEKVVATVTSLRAKAPVFDDQMETVKKLLIAAGVSDLGNGLPAAETFLENIKQIVPAPDGSLYFFTGSPTASMSSIIWRVNTEQELERLTAVGVPSASEPTDGQAAVDAKLGAIKSIALDASGRLWIHQATDVGNMWRLSVDRKTIQLVGSAPDIKHFVPTTGDSYTGITWKKWGGTTQLVEVTGNQTPIVKQSFAGPSITIIQSFQRIGRTPDGQLVGSGLISPSIIPKAYRIDPVTGTVTLIKAAGGNPNPVSWVTSDEVGRVYYSQWTSKTINQLPPVGDEVGLSGFDLPTTLTAITVGADNAFYIVDELNPTTIYRVSKDARSVFAGKEGQPPLVGVDPTKLPLKAPSSLVVARTGDFYLIDDGAILKVNADTGTTTVLEKGALGKYTPYNLKLSPGGDLYFLGSDPTTFLFDVHPPLYRLAPNGKPEIIYTPQSDVNDYVLAPSGAILISEIRHQSIDHHLTSLKNLDADGNVTTLIGEDKNFVNQTELAWNSDGKLLIWGATYVNSVYTQGVWRWAPGAEAEPLPDTTPWPDAKDPQGRIYEGYHWFRPTATANTLRRTNPGTGAVDIIVGPGGKFFTGSGVDDGVSRPRSPAFDGAGNLYFIDTDHKQVKKVLASELP